MRFSFLGFHLEVMPLINENREIVAPQTELSSLIEVFLADVAQKIESRGALVVAT